MRNNIGTVSLRAAAMILAAGLGSAAQAQVANLRITEVDPLGNIAEVRNDGPMFVTPAAFPFCHRFIYGSNIPLGISFDAGQYRTFTVASLNDTDSDLWLYSSSAFTVASNIVHGVKYGPAANVGRSGLASGRVPPLWTGGTRFAPAPTAGQTLAWDGFGIDPRDWYVDATPTLGAADSTTPAVVPNTIQSTGGVQTFEDVSLGDTIEAIEQWFFVNTSTTEGIFTARSVHDVNGTVTPRGASNRWIRIRDQDAGAVQNRFYAAEIDAVSVQNYTWTMFINIEETPPAAGGGSLPRLLIQHLNTSFAFVNTWGVQLSSTGGSLIGPGLTPQELFPLSGATGLLNWIRIDFTVNVTGSTISASVNGTPVVTDAPITIAPDINTNVFRFCYRGEGAGNVASLLLDDLQLSFSAAPPFCQGDADGNGSVNFGDITSVLTNFGNDYTPNSGPGDADNSSVVNFGDVTSVLINFAVTCP